MGTLRTGSYFTWPAGDKWNTYPTLINVTFNSTELSTAFEENRVGAALTGRTVIAGKNNERILVQSKTFKFTENLPNIAIKPMNHGRISRPRISLGGVAGYSMSDFVIIAPKWSLRKDPFIFGKKTVFGDYELCVGKRIGQKKKKGLIAILFYKI